LSQWLGLPGLLSWAGLAAKLARIADVVSQLGSTPADYDVDTTSYGKALTT